MVKACYSRETYEAESLYHAELFAAYLLQNEVNGYDSGECKKKTEADYMIFFKDGKYHVGGKSWFESQLKIGFSRAPGGDKKFIEEMGKAGYSLVKSIHNHYDGIFKWPTISDAYHVIETGVPVIVYGCGDTAYEIDVDGVVYSKNLNTGQKILASFDKFCRNDNFCGVDDTFHGKFSVDHLPSSDEFKFLYDGKNPTFQELGKLYKNMNNSHNLPGGRIIMQDSNQPDLHNLNLDDPNGDWCKCKQPGCRANMDVKNGYVLFGCTKCMKVNVKYAKMALELEKKMKAAGTMPTWYGPNAEANAHRAASNK